MPFNRNSSASVGCGISAAIASSSERISPDPGAQDQGCRVTQRSGFHIQAAECPTPMN